MAKTPSSNGLRASANHAEERGQLEVASELHALADFSENPSLWQQGSLSATPPPNDLMGGELFSNIEEYEQEWLWPGRLPLSEVVLLFGQQGTGKSTLSADLTARISNGWAMPDEQEGMPGNVILINSEDKSATTTVRRLKQAGANLHKVFDRSYVEHKAPYLDQPLRSPFTLPDDLPVLEADIYRMPGVALVIIDNIMACVSDRVSTFRNQTVRRKILAPLDALAERTGVCILLIGHLTKGSNNRDIIDAAGGSKGFTDKARIVLGLTVNPNNPSQRVLSNAKYNHMDPEALPMVLEYKNGRVVYLSGYNPNEAERMEATRLSENRQRVLVLLGSEQRMFTSTEIAHTLRLDKGHVRTLLSRMHKDGQICYPARNCYAALPINIPQESHPAGKLN